MKRYIVPTLVLATLAVVTAATASADQSPSPSSRNELRLEVRASQRAEIASKSQANQERLREKRESERRERITKFWRKTGERLQKLINRETKVADKIEARLQRFEDAGKDVATQETALIAARVKIAASQSVLASASADAQLKVLIEQNKPTSEIMARVRVLHRSVLAAIRDAHKALVAVVVSTRGLSSPTPTPTP